MNKEQEENRIGGAEFHIFEKKCTCGKIMELQDKHLSDCDLWEEKKEPMTNQQIDEQFDKTFELESQGCYECGGFELIDLREIRFPKGKYYCEFDLDKIKSFIHKVIAERDEALKEKIKDMRENDDFAYEMKDNLLIKWKEGHNRAIDKILSLLE